MRPSRLLLFDLDGTLVDSRLTIAHYFIEALNECEITHLLSPEVIGRYVAMPFWEINLHLRLNMDPERFEHFIETYRRLYLLVKPWVRTYPISPQDVGFFKDAIVAPH